MAVSEHYAIHDRLKFSIRYNAGCWHRLYKDVRDHYRSFLAGGCDDPDVVFEIGRFATATDGCRVLDDRYYIGRDYFYCRGDAHKQAKWSFDIQGLSQRTTFVRIASNLPGCLFVAGNVIDPVLQLKLAGQGLSVVHASCVSKDGNAYLFPARSGGGKTTIALNLVQRGYRYLGDNFIILDRGEAISYISPLNIATYNLAPIVRDSLTARNRLEIGLKKMVYDATGGYVKSFTHLYPRETFPESIDARAKLKSVYFLVPRGRFGMREMAGDELIDKLVANQQLDSIHLNKCVIGCRYVDPDACLAGYWDRYRENLERNIPRDVRTYAVEVPYRYDSGTIDRILEAMR